MTADFFSAKFAAALPYDRYVQTGTQEQRRRWRQVYDAATLTEAQRQLLAGFVRPMNLLVISGIWCGDSSSSVRCSPAPPRPIPQRSPSGLWIGTSTAI